MILSGGAMDPDPGIRAEKGAGMGLFQDFISQTRKPEGFLGKMMVSGMNSGHAKLADWGLSHLPAEETVRKAIDLGCGGGRNVGVLLKKYPGARVAGIDYSEVSVKKAKAYNQKMIRAGRCVIRKGDVSSLISEEEGSGGAVVSMGAGNVLKPESYDLATAFETIYFWPGLTQCFGQAAKLLKKGGIFLICNESDGTDEASLKYEKIIDGMKCYTPKQIEAALRDAGFSEVTADRHPSKPWITVIAKK